MATFAQWQRLRKVTRVAWVCGSEAALQREVAAAYRKFMPGVALTCLWGDDERAITPVWDYVLTVPSAPRLVFVFQAERLDLARLPLLLDDALDSSYVVFFSGDDDFAYDQPPGQGQRKTLVTPLAALRDSRNGQLVRCCAPKDDEARAALVAAWWPGAGRNLAAQLLERCGGSLGEAREAVRKAELAGLAAAESALPLVCTPSPREDFADQLVAGNRRAAMKAAARVPPDDLGGLFALLSARLGMLAVLGTAVRAGRDAREEGIRLKIDPYLVRLLRSHAASYDGIRVGRCREVLALAESAWKSGARDGVAEAVAALW